MQSQWGLGAWALAMIFVAGVEGFCISAPPATASRATGARVRLGLKMATTTQHRYGAPQRKGQKSDWWEEITQEIFQGEKIPLLRQGSCRPDYVLLLWQCAQPQCAQSWPCRIIGRVPGGDYRILWCFPVLFH